MTDAGGITGGAGRWASAGPARLATIINAINPPTVGASRATRELSTKYSLYSYDLNELRKHKTLTWHPSQLCLRYVMNL
jgi:hypothetical protein